MATYSQSPKHAEQNGHAFAGRGHGLSKALAVEGDVKLGSCTLALAYSERPLLTLVGGEGNNSEKPGIEEASVRCDARAT